MSVVEFPCGREGVLELRPHRNPFVWVSRIIECEPGESIVAQLDVDRDLPLFEGHFPGKPVLPGVIITEALAQAACCCLMTDPAMQGRIGFLVGIDKAKFRNQVLPGDTLDLEAKIVRRGKLMCTAEVTASKIGADGEKVVCASAIQKYILDGE